VKESAIPDIFISWYKLQRKERKKKGFSLKESAMPEMFISWYKFSKVSAQAHLLQKVTMHSTFENGSSPRSRTYYFPGTNSEKSVPKLVQTKIYKPGKLLPNLKVSAQVHLLHKSQRNSTFTTQKSAPMYIYYTEVSAHVHLLHQSQRPCTFTIHGTLRMISILLASCY
jgi:hypothetical protein